MKRLLILITFSLLLINVSLVLANSTATQTYEEASKAYYDGNYEKSVLAFEKILDEDPHNPYVEYNLGNVHYKLGNIGIARLYYEKAKLKLPRFQDLRTNLNLLKTKLTDEIQKSFTDYLMETFYFWTDWLTVSEYRVMLLVITCLFWILCIIKLLRKRQLVQTSMILLLLVFVYFSAGYYLKQSADKLNGYGIIIKPHVDVRASFLEKNQPLFQLHQGTKIKIVAQQKLEKSWVKIALPKGQKGWVLLEDVGQI